MEKKKTLGLILLLFVLLGGGYYLKVRGPKSLVFGPAAKPPSATPFPPPDWEIYQSPGFGYSLFRPPEWGLREQGRVNDRILDVTSLLVSFQGKRIPVAQIKISSRLYEEELAQRGIRISGFASEGRMGEKVLIGGVEGVKMISEMEDQGKTISVFLPEDEKTFILLGFPEAVSEEDYTETINQVFSTLRLP